MSSHLAGERSRRITLIKLISGKTKKRERKGEEQGGRNANKKKQTKNNPMHKIDSSTC